MTSVPQFSFSRGEIAPGLYARVDLAAYQSSLRTCRNWLPQPYGGVQNRPGTRYIASVKDHGARVRLFGFSFNVEQTYILEFGNLYLRVFKDGGQVLYSSGEHAGEPVEVVTPYTTEDLPFLYVTQNADVMHIVHPAHPPMSLGRTAHDAWTLTEFVYQNGPFQEINVDTAKTIIAVEGVDPDTGAPFSSLEASQAIFTPDKVGMLLYLEQAGFGQPWEVQKDVAFGAIRRSDQKYYMAQQTGTTGTLRPTHSTPNESWSDGGVDWVYLHPGWGVVRIKSVSEDGTQAVVDVLSRIPNAMVGAVSGTHTHKWAFGAWGGDQGYPGCVDHCQQRLAFGGTPAAPETVWMSRTNSYPDFGTSNPIQSDDALTFTLAARQVNAVRGLVSLDRLAVLTSGSEWIVKSGQDDALKPTNLSPTLKGFCGCAQVPPLGIGNTALYVQQKGRRIRDLGAEINADGSSGQDLQDLTIFASHLLKRNNIQEWAWHQEPHCCVWMVRDDGVLLSMTYLREQQVLGWAWHDTDGIFESVAVVSEGDEDALYVTVRRTVNGATRRYIERLETREIRDVRTCVFMDSALTFDGRNTTPITLAFTGGTNWGEGETITATASAPIFAYPSDSDLGDGLVFEDAEGRAYTLILSEVVSSTVARGLLQEVLPVPFRGVARKDWAWARGTFRGVDHLEGKTVSILSDGNVEGQQVVVGGMVNLVRPARFVSLGLPIAQADLETLDLVVAGQETLLNKRKTIPSVSFLLLESRGLFAGKDFDHLDEKKDRPSNRVDLPVPLTSEIVPLSITSNWSTSGRVCVRQVAPLPITILGIIPEFVIGGA